MNRIIPFYFFTVLGFGLCVQPVIHQAVASSFEEEYYRVETVDGSVFIGVLMSEDEERVVLQSETLGEITIERVNIRRMTRIDPDRIREGRYWFENPQATRYFFAPSAIGIKKGRGYYQNTWIFFNNVNYGLTDNFSIGGGLVPVFLFGASGTPVWILPKISLPLTDNLNLAAGAMAGTVLGGPSESLGLIYGAGTYGSADRNITAGLGYGYVGTELSDSPVVNLSGILRVSQRVYLLSENYFFPDTDFNGLVSFGMRWAPERFAVDFGLFRPLEEAGSLIGVPWLGVSIPFGDL